MDDLRIANIVGALALALSDDLQNEAERNAPEVGLAAAAIALLRHVPDMTIERLRRALGLSHPGAVRLIDRLEQEGTVVRRPSTADRRAVSLSLTKSGTGAAQAILSARESALRGALAGLTAGERKTFGALAEKMLRTLLRGEDHAFRVCRLCDNKVCIDCPVDEELRARTEFDPADP